MSTRVHYPEEIKWEAIKMKQAGKTNKEIMEQLGKRGRCHFNWKNARCN
jgi:transposase